MLTTADLPDDMRMASLRRAVPIVVASPPEFSPFACEHDDGRACPPCIALAARGRGAYTG